MKLRQNAQAKGPALHAENGGQNDVAASFRELAKRASHELNDPLFCERHGWDASAFAQCQESADSVAPADVISSIDNPSTVGDSGDLQKLRDTDKDVAPNWLASRARPKSATVSESLSAIRTSLLKWAGVGFVV